VTVQAQILGLLKKLQEEQGLGLLLITHDLHVVAQVCDSVMVMYAGRCVERGSSEAVLNHAAHPYTKALLASVPDLHSEPGTPLNTIGGMPPKMLGNDRGCAFAPRCPQATDHCLQQLPSQLPLSPVQQASCHALVENRGEP
jgi:oligopeptide/dipeptide ABC transporter ATP-binding protein